MTDASTPTSAFIATPTLDGLLSVHYTGALLRSQALLQRERIGCEIRFEIGNSLIADARNKLVAGFLASAHTDLVFIDADLSWQPADLLRLLRHDADVVAGAYQRKDRAKVDFSVKFGPRIQADTQGLLPAERVGTGFLRIRRTVLERLVAAHPQLALRKHDGSPAPHLYALFDTSIVDGRYVGEDFTFCDRWRALGGQVMVDPEIGLAHHGSAAYDEPLKKYLLRD